MVPTQAAAIACRYWKGEKLTNCVFGSFEQAPWADQDGKVPMPKIAMTYSPATDSYQSAAGLTLARETDTWTPNGNPMNGRWALRDHLGNLVDFGRYRNDLAERNDLRLLGSE